MSLRSVLLVPLATAGCLAAPAEPIDAQWGTDGRLVLNRGGRGFASAEPGLFEAGWVYRTASPDSSLKLEPPQRALRIPSAAGAVKVVGKAEAAGDGVRLSYTLTPPGPVAVNSVHVSFNLPTDLWRGGSWAADDKQGVLPRDFGQAGLYSAPTKSLTLKAPDGTALTLSSDRALSILVQDDRQWGPSFSVRVRAIEGEGKRWAEPATITLVVSGQPKLALGVDQPVTLKADEQWAPITGSLDIVPGSALDFRPLGLLDAPAGRHGWLVARGPKLVYEQRPDKPVRYYGVNFCFSALYLDKALADRAADRLAALGYNSVRIHHYESGLVAPGPNSLTFKPEALDKLDYFAAALKQRGLYLTTDLFVSRPIRAAETVEGGTDMNGYKSAVLVSDVARDNLKAFTCALLTHVNPYTKLAWGQDPALNMLSLVNEGAALNFIGGLKGKLRDLYVARFNAWLAARYGTREKLAEAWGGALKAGQDLAAGTVPLPGGTGGANGRDLALFAARLQSDFADDMKRFLRDELKCRALITDMNARSDNWGTQLARTHLDYVDNHGYWDHPRFLEREWQLPSKGWSGGGSATARGVPLHGDKAATRLLDRPFGFSEFNYAAPNVYRAESGPLTGGYAALQDWDAVWRFSYSHDVRNLQALRGGNFFDMATDLTQQAGDRFAVLLFLRDAASARAKVALTATQAELTGVKGPGLGLPGVQRLALVSQVGTLVDPQAPAAAGELRVSGGVNEAALLARLREQGLLAKDNPTNPDQDLYVSDTGQLRLDSRQGLFCFDTPRCQGVFSAFGRGAKVGALTTADGGAPIGVYLASLGETPIPTSPRLLLAHVPDTQGTGRRFGERALLTLFDWGGLPQLVRDVSTTITLALEQPAAYKVYALGLDGGRLASVETQVVGGALRFTARSRQGETGSLYYELTR